VIPGGPADLAEGGLQDGDVLLRVEGQAVGRTANLYAPIVARGGDPVRIDYRRGEAEREATLRPVAWGQLRQAIYEADVKANRARVEELSDARWATSTSRAWASARSSCSSAISTPPRAARTPRDRRALERRRLATDLLLTILTQPVHAYTIPRGGEAGYPDAERLPLQRWNKPIAVVCDESATRTPRSSATPSRPSAAVRSSGRRPAAT